MRIYGTILWSALLLGTSPVAGQVPFPVNPNWTSTDENISTGAALVDINQDGWIDLVAANGNDIERQHLVVYLNRKDGTFPPTPDWQSADIDYHGHLAAGDVNGDGFPDIAVSVYIGEAGFSMPGYVKLYMNDNGALESTPSWRSEDSMYTFSCAFGDADGDGAPDLAVACGEAYNSRAEQSRVYMNRGGRLGTLPSWKSTQSGYSYDVGWGDIDNDGLLDLVFANERGPNTMYKNRGDSIANTPSWQSADPSQFANSLALGDINNDGFIDLAISDNDQLGGTGHFKIYLNNGGTLDPIPYWNSFVSGTQSGIMLVDVTNDGWRELIGGGWWEPCRVYLNIRGKFGQQATWTSSTGSVVEAIVAADVDNAGLDTARFSYTGDGSRTLFKIPRSPAQRLISVVRGQEALTGAEYCSDIENGWISLAAPLEPGDTLVLSALVSHSLDLAVTNWDPHVGNYLFMNTGAVSGLLAGTEGSNGLDLLQNFPNPFNNETAISYYVPPAESSFPTSGRTRLMVFDLSGKEIATLVNRFEPPGQYMVHFDASHLPSGVYFYRLHAGGRVVAKRMVLMK